jgi:hypothetical protein
MQQRIWLRKSETRVMSQGSSKSTLECPPSSNRYPPRRSGWFQTYAGYAVTKGNSTRARTRWPEIGQRFSPFPLKMAPYAVSALLGSRFFLPAHECGVSKNGGIDDIIIRVNIYANSKYYTGGEVVWR